MVSGEHMKLTTHMLEEHQLGVEGSVGSTALHNTGKVVIAAVGKLYSHSRVGLSAQTVLVSVPVKTLEYHAGCP
jgi:hypothetical protein